VGAYRSREAHGFDLNPTVRCDSQSETDAALATLAGLRLNSAVIDLVAAKPVSIEQRRTGRCKAELRMAGGAGWPEGRRRCDRSSILLSKKRLVAMSSGRDGTFGIPLERLS
jgi:hypothetical protein